MYKDIISNSELFTIKYPQTIVPSPTQYDYENGFIERYFLQKANDSNGNIFEVSENVFESYKKNPFWIGEQLYWRISGPIDTLYKDNGDIDDKGVINSNKSSINLASKKIKNIRLYLPNILQFYK